MLIEPLTPNLELVTVASRLATRPGFVWLDSALQTETGRYSYLAAEPVLTLTAHGNRLTYRPAAGAPQMTTGDAFAALTTLLAGRRRPPIPDLPPFQGGAIGYFGYALGRADRTAAYPDLWVGFYDWVVAADHQTGQRWLIARDPAAGRTALAHIQQGPPRPARPLPPPPRWQSNFDQPTYEAIVRRAQEYIAAGDIYQVNLSQRFCARWDGDPWTLYLRLRARSAAPYAAYLAAGEVTLLSASPERFLRLDGDQVETRPIKGTRPRGTDPASDAALAAELAASAKDRAENLMIVDLLRNDLGQVSAIGSVSVPRLFGLEAYPQVWHLVSTVTSRLRAGVGAVDLLRACFPGGSVTGCPKRRALEIITELETVPRGAYCGTIGYLADNGAMDTAITIRTLICTRGEVHLHVGGAVVADSDPAAEYAETLAKARGGLAAFA